MASTFTQSQITAFLSYIGLPSSLHEQRYTGDAPQDLKFLTLLNAYTISAMPYESLSIHYSPSHSIPIAPQTVYSKIVTSGRGRGGYCMETGILFNHILRGLGFPVYTSAVRVRLRENGVPVGDYAGCRHIVNIITLSDGSKWMVDVGFGGDGATAPLPLIHGATNVNIGIQENRLIQDWIPNQTVRTPETKLWIYQFRNGPEREWNDYFAFAESETLEADFEILNFFTGTHPQSFQVVTPLVVKFLRRTKADEAEEEIYGKRMLVANVVKENLGGKTQVIQVCETEDERVEALRTWFGIELTDEERKAIRGWPTELA